MFVSFLNFLYLSVEIIDSLVYFKTFFIQLAHFTHAVVLLLEERDGFCLKFVADFVLLVKFLFEVGLLVFVVDLDFIKFFSLLILDLSHF